MRTQYTRYTLTGTPSPVAALTAQNPHGLRPNARWPHRTPLIDSVSITRVGTAMIPVARKSQRFPINAAAVALYAATSITHVLPKDALPTTTHSPGGSNHRLIPYYPPSVPALIPTLNADLIPTTHITSPTYEAVTPDTTHSYATNCCTPASHANAISRNWPTNKVNSGRFRPQRQTQRHRMVNNNKF